MQTAFPGLKNQSGWLRGRSEERSPLWRAGCFSAGAAFAIALLACGTPSSTADRDTAARPHQQGLVATVASECVAGDQPVTLETPSEEQVLELAKMAKDGIVSCGQHHLTEEVMLVVLYSVDGTTGGVTQVSTEPEGLPVLECVARVLAHLCYVPFTESEYRIKFPYRLNE